MVRVLFISAQGGGGGCRWIVHNSTRGNRSSAVQYSPILKEKVLLTVLDLPRHHHQTSGTTGCRQEGRKEGKAKLCSQAKRNFKAKTKLHVNADDDVLLLCSNKTGPLQWAIRSAGGRRPAKIVTRFDRGSLMNCPAAQTRTYRSPKNNSRFNSSDPSSVKCVNVRLRSATTTYKKKGRKEKLIFFLKSNCAGHHSHRASISSTIFFLRA